MQSCCSLYAPLAAQWMLDAGRHRNTVALVHDVHMYARVPTGEDAHHDHSDAGGSTSAAVNLDELDGKSADDRSASGGSRDAASDVMPGAASATDSDGDAERPPSTSHGSRAASVCVCDMCVVVVWLPFRVYGVH